MPVGRLGRAATFAFGAVLATATAAVGCGDDDTPPPGTDSGVVDRDSGGSDASAEQDASGPVDSGSSMALYGAVPVDSGGGGAMPLYGAPP